MTKTSTVPRLCNARHAARPDIRCELAPGHKGDHETVGGGHTWPRNPRGATPAQRAAGAASAVLTDLAAGFSHSAIAKRHGISRQRVGAIAAAAGQSTPVRSTKGLLSRLLELAAAAGEDPADWLEEAARCRAACEAIVALIERVDIEDSPMRMIRFAEDVKRLAIGHNPPELAAQVRAVVEAAK